MSAGMTERGAALLVLECLGAHFTGGQSEEIAARVEIVPVLVAATAIGQLAAVIERCASAEGGDRQDILRDLYAGVQGLDDTEYLGGGGE